MKALRWLNLIKGAAFFALMSTCALPAVGQSLAEAMVYLEDARFQTEVILPYQADQARVAQITQGMNSLEAGLTVAEVRTLIGAPDEIEALFVMGERSEELQGFQYSYLLERTRINDWGQAYQERYIHVNFNLSGKLVSAEGYAVPQFKEVVRELGLGFEFSMGIHETVRINGLQLRLDMIEGTDAQNGAESAGNVAFARGREALFSVSLPDRADNLRLGLGDGDQSTPPNITYGNYRIRLLAITAQNRVSLVVE